MQQTQKYKLNLIESSDPFMPEGLNQNTQKVEQVLAAQEAANDQKVAAVAGQVAALGAASDQKFAEMSQRVTVLEAHRFIIGTYQGNGTQSRFLPLGFTPLAIFVSADPYPRFAAAGVGSQYLSIAEGGIQISSYSPGSTNSVEAHAYIAFV